jgi:hypothetical protein
MIAVDEECVFDMDCQFDGGYCNENKCAVKAKGNQHVFSSSGELMMILFLNLNIHVLPIKGFGTFLSSVV